MAPPSSGEYTIEKHVAREPFSEAAERGGPDSELIASSSGSDLDLKQGGAAGGASPVEVRVRKVMVLPSVAMIDQRLALYGEKVSNWQTLAEQIEDLELLARRPPNWPDCFNRIENIFRGYSLLMEVALKLEHPSIEDENLSLDPWQIYNQDISYLESGCEQVFMASAALVNGLIDRHTDSVARQSESIVGQYAGKGRYEEAIIAFQNLMAAYPERDVSLDTRRMYGLALLKTGKLEMAGEVLDGTLKEMTPSPEERSLRRLVADLLLASGRIDLAKKHYRRLADFFESRKGDDRWVADQLALLSGVEMDASELPLYMDVLRSYITFDGLNIPAGMKEQVEKLEEEFPDSPFSFRARQMFGQTEDSARGWITSKMDRIDAYLKKKDFSQAKATLEMMLAGDLPVSMRETVQRTMDDVLLAEMRSLEEQKALLEQTLGEQWEKAVNNLESRKFDEAINAFTALLDTDYDAQAREKIRETSEKAAAEMRRLAAGIFVKARKEGDYDRKKQLFKECWGLLNDIMIKYPEVSLISKVKQNIEIIEQQIVLFDPELLPELKGLPAGGNKTSLFNE
ncbi:MAG: hypothetical protein KKG35_06265 [Proteobacteria bacterium]|nr:hypothetical protein [Pseudomonadota bacterium]